MKKLQHTIYAAGLFDGEGWFSIIKSKRKDIKREYSYQIQAALVVRQKEVILWLQKNFGGSVKEQPGRKPQHSITYRWVISGYQVRTFAQKVLPFLKIKNKQAKLAIAFQNTKEKQGNRPLTDEIYNNYTIYDKIMKIYNRKGPNKKGEDRELDEFKKKLGLE